MLLGQHDPCGLSHSHSCSGTKAEDQTSLDGTCCNFFLPTRSPHEGSHVRRVSPDTIILKNMGQGWCSFGGLTVWQGHRRSTWKLMGGVTHNKNLHRLLDTLHYYSSQIATEACEQWHVVVLKYFESVSQWLRHKMAQLTFNYYNILRVRHYTNWRACILLLLWITWRALNFSTFHQSLGFS